MHVSEFDYHLPAESIAQEPLADRSASRMLVVHREEGRWEDRAFRDLPDFLRPGDCLALNDSKVFPARLYGQRVGTGGAVEVFLLRPEAEDNKTWTALVRPGRRMRTGERVRFADVEAEIVGRGEFGERTLRFDIDGDIYEWLNGAGHVPLPPYIHRSDRADDISRYQTVYARAVGSVAAPTAGLHFTPQVLDHCREAGADVARVTLHVGLGTFQPLHTENVEDVKLHSERFEIPEESAAKLRAAARIVAVGTTSVRTIETAMRTGGMRACCGETELFVYPGFDFRAIGAMVTNFHLPQSSLLMLVCAFGGKDLVLDAYRHAVAAGYRFYSYGDCMLVV
ncbi:MAG: tRNA preQ1(34) S-adenosylmethionine ribosyltransferase-isomerase QueA [Bryobacteraceae bacterium]